MTKWVEEELKFLSENWFNANKSILLNTLNNRTWGSIKKRAQIIGVSRTRSRGNVKFFDEWSNDMAYILGFIMADGNILERKFSLEITLSFNDFEHLKKIRNIMGPNININVCDIDGGKYKYARIATASNYMYKRLISLGVLPRKSLILNFPNIPEKYLNHFVRGYFDGDGSIYRYKNKWGMNILGTKNFLLELNFIFNDRAGVGLKKIQKPKKQNIYRISYYKKDMLKIGGWLYKNSSLHLDRKYDKFSELLGIC